MTKSSRLISRKLVCAPVTALCFLDPSLLLAGQGPYLKLYDVGAQEQLDEPIFQARAIRKHRIHLIVYNSTSGAVIIAGGKEAALLTFDRERELNPVSYWTAPDWILSAAFVGADQVLLITSHNVVLSYTRTIDEVKLQEEVACIERPLLWSAGFSQTCYEKVEDVYLAVGTIMHEILLWKPFTDKRVERRFQGHEGSVFFVSFAPRHTAEQHQDERIWTLASGSDDRSVRIWRWRDSSSHFDCEELLGHTHRPWRGVWDTNAKYLLTAGEDLNCILWQTPTAAPVRDWPRQPQHTWHGHEGKNIWSLAQSSTIIATGGADGAIRLWPLGSRGEALVQTAFAPDVKDRIAAFDAGQDHLLVVTRQGHIHYRTGNGKTVQHIAYLEQASAQIFVCMDEKKQIAWLMTRQGRVARVALAKTHVSECATGCSAIAVAARHTEGSTYLAAFDRKSRRLCIYEHANQEAEEAIALELLVKSQPLHTDRTPVHLCWQDNSTLILADSIASVWIYKLSPSGHGSGPPVLEVVYAGRLHVRGTFGLWPADDGQCFRVGNKDQCTTYKIFTGPDSFTIVPIGISCLGYGRVQQVSESRTGRRYICCTSVGASIVDEAGNILASVNPPYSSSSTLQVVSIDASNDFYSMTPDALHFQRALMPCTPLLQAGLHGREIRSIAMHRFPSRLLAATGSEDGILKISSVDKETLAFKTLLRLRDSTAEGAGAVANLVWSPTGSKDPHTALLFVTAAQGALYSLRVTELHSGELQVRRNPMASDPAADEDCRITALDVARLSGSHIHVILAGYSDGAVKVWHFSEQLDAFELQWSRAPRKYCVLSARLVLHNHSQLIMAIGSTNGSIELFRADGEKSGQLNKALVPWPTLVSVHQSGVNGIDVRIIERDQTLIIVSGGDDNAIVYQEIRSNGQSSLTRFASAHASSLKGIRLVDDQTFVTSSTDQRVTLWRYSEIEAKLERVHSVLSHVADVADIELLKLEDGRHAVAVCGVGLEMLELQCS